jgi:hypothetical protein
MREEEWDAAGASERDLWLPWFAYGVMTGVALTLLFTPVSGRDTRRFIAQTGGATRRRTAAVLERNRQALAVIRKYGVVGLARQRARSRREAARESAERGQTSATP